MYLLSDRTSKSKATNVNNLGIFWKTLFTRKRWSVGSIPSRSKALKLHVLGTALLASLRIDSLKKQPIYDNSTEGWWRKFDEQYIPPWMDLPYAMKFCRELIKYNCKKLWNSRYNRHKQELQCTELCGC